ncbi:fibronectin type III domain-containing protein [Dactylosporangium cerinum]
MANAPAAPTQVSATTVDRGLRVAWVHDGSGVDHYVATAYDREGVAAGSCLGALPSTAACDIGAGGAYVVRVVAFGGAGAAVPSSPASSDVVVIPGTVPPAPVGSAPAGGGGVLSAAPGEPVELVVTPGDRQLMVEWRARWPHDGVAGYTVHVEEDAGLDCVTTEEHCTIVGLTNGTSYTVRVRADGTGGSGESAWVTPVATPSQAPGEPTGVTAVARIEAITVSWVAGAPGTGVARFQALATSTVGGDQGVCESVDGNTCTISGLRWGDTYTVAVKALGRHGRNSGGACRRRWRRPRR